MLAPELQLEEEQQQQQQQQQQQRQAGMRRVGQARPALATHILSFKCDACLATTERVFKESVEKAAQGLCACVCVFMHVCIFLCMRVCVCVLIGTVAMEIKSCFSSHTTTFPSMEKRFFSFHSLSFVPQG